MFSKLATCLILCFVWQLTLCQHKELSIFEPTTMHRVNMVFEMETWADSLMKYKSEGNNDRIAAQVTIDNRLYEEVQIRYKGHSSYNNFAKADILKLPFNLKIKKSSDTPPFEGKIRTIKLSNLFRDRSYVREYLSYQIISTYLPLPQIAFAEVYVNDQYLGLYEIIEAIDEPFLERTFGDTSGVFIKGDPIWSAPQLNGCPNSENASLQYLGKRPECYNKWYELKSDHGWSELISLTSTLNKNLSQIESQLDVHSTLWMLALNNVLVSLDSYSGALCHNYYLYKSTDGLFTPLMWDFNLSFGAFKSTGVGSKLNLETMQEMSPYIHLKERNAKRPLITQLLSVDLYRKLYINMMRTIVDDYLTNNRYLEIGRQTQAFIYQSVQKEQEDIYSFSDFEKNLTDPVITSQDSLVGIAQLMEGRKRYLERHPSLRQQAPKIVYDQIKIDFGTRTVQFQQPHLKAAKFYYRVKGKSAFQSIKMIQQTDSATWKITKLPEDIESYYFVLENDDTATLFPKHAPWHPFKTK